MLRRFTINFALFSMALDGLIVGLCLWASGLIRPYLNNIAGIEIISSPVSTPSLLFILFPVIWLVIATILSIYDGRKYIRAADEFTALTTAMIISTISAAGILYLSFRDVSRALFMIFIVMVYLFMNIWRVGFRLLFRIQQPTSYRIRRVLIVGVGPLGQRVHSQLGESTMERLLMIGFVDDGFEDQSDHPLLLGKREEIREIVLDQKISDVIIALPYSNYNQMGDLVKNIEDLPVQVWVALGFFDLALYNTAIEDFAGIPMLDLRASAINDYQRMMKRAFDLILGTTALILASPFLAISASMILIDDGVPIFFRQIRVGENGKLFHMLKFRTMIKDAEKMRSMVEQKDDQGNIIHKVKGDPRVTPVGRFLRRFSLDELPQLVNVVRGEMSLVGPRPELPYLVEKYKPWQRKRFAVPPGITGWWQVSGRSDKPMHLHTEDDLHYIQNYSIWMDIQILLRTIWIVLIGKGAY